jgi:hypothetical protein|tara:strand:+ start:457 stop:852 length:396 start_codon:yes stop_codon:yes gene_type:complete
MNSRYDHTNPNINFNNDKVINLVQKLIYKGQTLEWKDEANSNYFRDSWAKIKVTSVKVNSWGSIYVNLRLIDGEHFNKPLRDEFTKQKTQYQNKQARDRWKWHTLTGLVYNQVKLMGIPGGKIFIKRLAIK